FPLNTFGSNSSFQSEVGLGDHIEQFAGLEHVQIDVQFALTGEARAKRPSQTANRLVEPFPWIEKRISLSDAVALALFGLTALFGLLSQLFALFRLNFLARRLNLRLGIGRDPAILR
ncbi:MAG: hypothetical protein OXT06_09605, partial [Rhodospirillaceae bacterium]|nr:hypothetical protein [Rhodospirillaceae bacterium]